MTYDTYLFDFDLTLADSSRGIVKCFSNVLAANGYQPNEMAIKRTIGRTLEESFTILTGVSDDNTLARFKKEYTAEADIYMNDLTMLYPETEQTLKTLKQRGAKVGIISTKYRYRIQAVIDRQQLQDCVDLIVGGEDVTSMKPNPQGVLLAMERLGAEKSSTLYVGDSVVDAETAQRAGIDFCGTLTGMTTRNELAAFPHRKLVNNLADLLDN